MLINLVSIKTKTFQSGIGKFWFFLVRISIGEPSPDGSGILLSGLGKVLATKDRTDSRTSAETRQSP
ncbi:MAG: hypothetical protein JSS94_00650 [Bacteroidetes bacterium]|nr:hypothetical protein [Bacteroidota bacterium]